MPQQDNQRFLIIRLGSLGDLVHTLPGVAALRASFPNALIDWVVQRKWSPLIALASGIDHVIPLNRGFSASLRCISDLRRNGYSCAIDFQGLYKSAVLGWFSGARRRIGLESRFARESGSALFYTDRVIPQGQHVIERSLTLAAAAGAKWPDSLNFLLPAPPQEKTSVGEMLAREGVGDFCVISPGGGWKSKCWPPERYGALCRE